MIVDIHKTNSLLLLWKEGICFDSITQNPTGINDRNNEEKESFRECGIRP